MLDGWWTEMSNQVHIMPTIFIDAVHERVKSKTYGFRIYDDYSKDYDNTWDEIPELDGKLLEKVIASKDNLSEGKTILNYIKHSQSGLFIDSKWYDWEEIKSSFEEE